MAVNWRLAKSLETLRNQVNSAYPNRSKRSDGTIGDAAHASSSSDHNPNKNGVVCALDLTHDPANGFDVHALAEHLRKNRHPNLRYIISNARIAGWWTNWEWQPSSGHTQHAHFSVGTLGVGDGQTYDRYDDTTEWKLKEANMDNKLNLNAWRQLAHGILGRNGLSGRTNALDGSSDKSDYVGRVLDIHLINELFISDEAKTWRDAMKYSSIPEIQKRLDSIPALVKDRDNLKAENEKLKKEIAQGGASGEFTKVLSSGTDLYIKK